MVQRFEIYKPFFSEGQVRFNSFLACRKHNDPKQTTLRPNYIFFITIHMLSKAYKIFIMKLSIDDVILKLN